MKIILIALLLMSTQVVLARGLDLSITTNTFLTDEDKYSRASSGGVQLSYTPKKSFFMFISKDSIQVCPNGCAFRYTLTGVGIGDSIDVGNGISLFSQIGYFKITNDYGEKNKKFNEALGYYLNDRFDIALGTPVQRFEAYSVINKNAFSGTFGVSLKHNITKNVGIKSILSYRFLKIKETIQGWQNVKNNAYWETGSFRDYSSINIGLGLWVEF